MKKIILIIALTITSYSVSFGQVDENYVKTLKTMFKVTGSEETYSTVIKQMFTMFKEQYSNVEEKTWVELEKEFQKTSINDLVRMLAPVYVKYLNQEELQELIDFYSSPVGKKIAQSTPLITQESMQIGQEWGKKIGEEFVQKMKKKGY
ncbi:MAG: hypothetical protein CMP61_05845 [Flavobacteriales bacterium]|nr:hypothetical protein [Flavobacteriales bacterium]|tara:strand:- start:6768 stop:7214 length:447 start_codon:yes stop_codon:yes gene_type:complete